LNLHLSRLRSLLRRTVRLKWWIVIARLRSKRRSGTCWSLSDNWMSWRWCIYFPAWPRMSVHGVELIRPIQHDHWVLNALEPQLAQTGLPGSLIAFHMDEFVRYDDFHEQLL
jgi:hypothetical protein